MRSRSFLGNAADSVSDSIINFLGVDWIKQHFKKDADLKKDVKSSLERS